MKHSWLIMVLLQAFLGAEVVVVDSANATSLDTIEVKESNSLFEAPTFFETQSYTEGMPSQQRMSVGEAMNIPGVMSDPINAISLMAGVANSGGELIIHGSKPYETSTTINNFPVGYLYHYYGLHSVIQASTIEQLDVYLGGFDASFGGAMGGIIDVLPKIPDGSNSGLVHVGLFDSSAYGDFKLTDTLALSLGGRRTYYDVIGGMFMGEGVILPNYYDASFTLAFVPNESHIVTFENILADDFTKISFGEGDTQTTLEEHMRFATSALRWRYDNLDNLTSDTMLGYHTTNYEAMNLSNSTDTSGDSAYYYGFFKNRTTLLLEEHRISWGGEFQRNYNPYDYKVPNAALSSDERSNLFAGMNYEEQQQYLQQTTQFSGTVRYDMLGMYLQDIYTIGDALKVRYGLRGDWVDYQQFGWSIDPRVALLYQLGESDSFSVALGQYSQLPVISYTYDVVGNDALSYERAYHANLNYTHTFSPLSSLSLEPFYKKYTHLAITDSADKYQSSGDGYTAGFDATYKYRVAGWYLYATYSFQYAKRETNTTDGFTTFVDEIPHTLQIATTYEWENGWLASALLKYNTGKLYTPVDTSTIEEITLSDGSKMYVSNYGEPYSKRLPDFFSLNLKLAKKVKYENKHILEYSFELMNATSHANYIGEWVSPFTGKVEYMSLFGIIPWFDVSYRF